ncbi:hypothetical protein D9M73_50270 [compost metagenome]
MARLTGLFQRGGSYYLRIVLPNDHPLKSKYRNGRYIQTLGPSGYRKAVLNGTLIFLRLGKCSKMMASKS